jgi:hypothetical protein
MDPKFGSNNASGCNVRPFFDRHFPLQNQKVRAVSANLSGRKEMGGVDEKSVWLLVPENRDFY